jgi:hypothetical protein
LHQLQGELDSAREVVRGYEVIVGKMKKRVKELEEAESRL